MLYNKNMQKFAISPDRRAFKLSIIAMSIAIFSISIGCSILNGYYGFSKQSLIVFWIPLLLFTVSIKQMVLNPILFIQNPQYEPGEGKAKKYFGSNEIFIILSLVMWSIILSHRSINYAFSIVPRMYGVFINTGGFCPDPPPGMINLPEPISSSEIGHCLVLNFSLISYLIISMNIIVIMINYHNLKKIMF